MSITGSRRLVRASGKRPAGWTVDGPPIGRRAKSLPLYRRVWSSVTARRSSKGGGSGPALGQLPSSKWAFRPAANALDDAVLTQARDPGGVETEPVGKHFVGVLTEQWRRLDFARNAVEAHRPGRLRHCAFAVRHRLEDAALPEAGFVNQFLRIEGGARGDADRAQLCHRLVLRALWVQDATISSTSASHFMRASGVS